VWGLFPLTHSQKRIVVNQQIYPDSRFSHMYGKVCTENKNGAELSEAINAAISFFDCLRIRFVRSGKHIFQEISDYQHEDIITKPPGFDFYGERLQMLCGKLYRFYIVEENDGDHEQKVSGYFFIIHHAIADAYTITLIIKYIDEYHNGKTAGQIQQSFRLYAAAEQEYLRSSEYNSDYGFFEKKLSRSLSYKYIPEFDLSCGRAGKELSGKQTQAMLSYCKQKGISAFRLVYAALFVLLYLENGRTVQTISTTHHNRDTKELLQTGGMITSTIPIVQEIDFSLTFEEFLNKATLNVAESLERHRFPIDALMTGANQKSVFELNITEVTLNSIPFGDGSRISRFSPNEDISSLNFKLNPNSKPKGSDIEIAVDYATCRYTPQQAGQMLDRLAEIAFMFIERGNMVISEMLAPRDDIMVRIQKIISDHPGVPALMDGDSALTYGQLGAKIDAVADNLRESGCVIGIINQRSVWYVVALLGALKAGKAFAVLDPELPSQRIDDIIRQAKIDTVLAFSDAGHSLKNAKTVDIRRLDSLKKDSSVIAGDLAYILFTSGSSGKPKGVMVGRHGLLSLTDALIARYGIKNGERFSAYCDFNFDVSIAEIFLPLLTASTLFIVNDEARRDLKMLGRFMRDNKIENAFLPTKLGEAFIKNFPDCPISRLTIAGEKMCYYQKTKYQVFNGYGPTEFTVFSHIETIAGESARYSIGTPLKGVSDMVASASGGAVSSCGGNASVSVKAANGSGIAADNAGGAGEIGELVLIGEQAAFGYLNDYDMTSKRFIKIHAPGDGGYRRAYKTSDKVERGGDGKLYFISRMDRQIKLRGYRIELEEIESSAMDTGLVSEAVCVFIENEIILSVIPGAHFDEAALSRSLSEKLPRYAIPQRIVTVPGFPKTKTGKTDYKAYADNASTAEAKDNTPKGYTRNGNASKSYAQNGNAQNSKTLKSNAPKKNATKRVLSQTLSSTEKKLLRIFSAHTAGQAKGIKAADNIFDAGIDSLGILQIMLEVERKLKYPIAFSDFILYPTVQKMAAYIENGGGRQCVTKLREGSGKPLVLIFDMTRDIISYLRILRKLRPGYPVFGISPNNVTFPLFCTINPTQPLSSADGLAYVVASSATHRWVRIPPVYQIRTLRRYPLAHQQTA